MQGDFSSSDLAVIERTTKEVVRQIFDCLSRRQLSPLERRWWDDRIMAWVDGEAGRGSAFQVLSKLRHCST